MINRVFIGFDERQQISFTALQQSIVARTSKPVAIIPLVLRTLPITRAGLTPFTYSRFLTPWLCDFEGWALFMDVDMLLLDDIAKLFEMADDRYAVMVADTHDRFERASLMLFNCAHQSNRCLTPDFVEQGGLKTNLHSLGWLKEAEVGFLPDAWNHTVGIDAPDPDAKLVHYTMGTPVHPEIKGCEYTDPWMDAVETAVSSQSWAQLMGASTWAMELSDGRTLPRLHPDARREAEAIVGEIEEIRKAGCSAEKPSSRYRSALNRQDGGASGGPTPFSFEAAPEARAMLPHIGPIRHLCATNKARTLLDYGGTKQGLYDARDLQLPDGPRVESMRAFWELDAAIACYDPGKGGRGKPPAGQFDAVVCIGLLERIPTKDIVWLVEDLFAHAGKFLYAVVAGYQERAPDGRDLHETVRSKTWWEVLFRTVGAQFPDIRYFVAVNQPVKTRIGKRAIRPARFNG